MKDIIQKLQASCNSFFSLNKVWNFLFYTIIVITFGLFVYKADYTGTTYDESMTFARYCDSIHTARHVFDNPNNHVLNSIFIFYAQKLFGYYEHYIRIFPMLSGLIYFIGMAYIIKKIIVSHAYRVASLLLVYFIPYTFNYLFMARGYTYALSGFVLYIGLVFYLLDHPIAFRYWPVPVLLLTLTNFYVLGAMLAGIYMMVFVNGLFVLLFSSIIYKNRPSRLLATAIHGVVIACMTGLLLYLFYRPIFNEILHINESRFLASTIRAWKGWPSFSRFFEKLLRRQVFEFASWGVPLFYIDMILIAAGFIAFAAAVFKAVKGRIGSVFFADNRHGIFLLLLAMIYLLALLVYGGFLGRCPGLERSHIGLLPLLCVVSLWLIERFVIHLSEGRFKTGCKTVVWLLIMITALHKVPYLHSVFDGGMAMSKPTLRRLKALDPERTWNIVFAPSMRTYYMQFLYYKQFDTYKFNVNAPEANVLVCRPKDGPRENTCLDYEYYLKQNNCYVYLFIPPDPERMILEIKPRKTD